MREIGEKVKNFIISIKQKRTFIDYLTFFFFIFLFVSGLFLYKEYGISWDEPIQRAYGKRIYDNTLGDLDNLETSSEKYYGPAFEFVLTLVEYAVNPASLQETYELRHLTTFLFNFVGFVFFYKIAYLIFKRKEFALLAVLFLALSPRIYAHAFYNSKDLVFMSSVMIASYFSLVFLKRKTIGSVVLAALFNGFAIAIRVPGIFVPFITTLLFFCDFKFDKEKIKLVFVYTLLTMFVVYAMWPVLWGSPVREFLNAIDQMKSFHEVSSTMFFGRNVKGDMIPWFFVPVWIFITVPITQVIIFFLGLFLFLKNKIEKNKFYIFVLLWFFFPLALVIFLKSTLYDGWRQMFFIYPAFILIGLYSFTAKISDKYKLGLVALFCIVLLNHMNSFLFMLKNHPNHNVYFNVAAGSKKYVSENFALDYWGLVYKQLYEKLVTIVPEGQLLVYVDTYPGENNRFMIEGFERITIVKDLASADYFLTNFRGNTKTEGLEEVCGVVVGGIKIGAIYKVSPDF